MNNTTCENHKNPLAKNFTIGALLQFAFPTILMMIFWDCIPLPIQSSYHALDFTLIVLAALVLGTAVAVAGSLCIDSLIWGLGASELLFPLL